MEFIELDGRVSEMIILLCNVERSDSGNSKTFSDSRLQVFRQRHVVMDVQSS